MNHSVVPEVTEMVFKNIFQNSSVINTPVEVEWHIATLKRRKSLKSVTHRAYGRMPCVSRVTARVGRRLSQILSPHKKEPDSP